MILYIVHELKFGPLHKTQAKNGYLYTQKTKTYSTVNSASPNYPSKGAMYKYLGRSACD